MLFSVTLLCMFFFTICDDGFVGINFYLDTSFSEDSFLNTILLSLPSPCTTVPFGDEYAIFKIDNESFFESLRYELYDYPNCSVGLPRETIFYNFSHSIYTIVRSDEPFYVNFTYHEELPFNKNDSEKYYVQENYVDENCQEAVDGKIIENGYTFTLKTLEPSLVGQFVKYDTNIYCSDTFGLVEENYGGDYSYVEYYLYFPQVKKNNNQCFERFNYTYGANDKYVSIIPKCLNYSEATEHYLSSVPEQSLSKYEILSYHYDSNCSQDFSIKPWYTDVCNHRRTIYRTIEDGVVDISYYNEDCTGEVYQYQVIQSRPDGNHPFFGSCDLASEPDEIHNEIPNYFQRLKSDEIYYPDHVTLIVTRRIPCGEDITPVKISPTDTDFFSFLAEGRCVGFEEDELENYFSARGYGSSDCLSFEGKCSLVTGELKYWEYKESTFCYGYYDISLDDWCYAGSTGYYYHYTCYSYYCDGISQFDRDNVCSGHGDCDYTDTCECKDDYSGLYCEIPPDDGTVIVEGLSGEEIGAIVGGIVTSMTVFTVLIIILVLSCICTIIICVSLLLSVPLLVFSAFAFRWYRKSKKFGKLKNFDILLKEQELENDTSVAHLRINRDLFRIKSSDVNLEEEIGQGGGRAVVFRAKWRGNDVAYKVFKTKNMMDQSSFSEFEREVEILSSVNHPNILRFFGCTLEDTRVGIVIEFCPNGDLKHFLSRSIRIRKQQNKDNNTKEVKEKKYSVLSVEDKLRYIHEIILAMDYLHVGNVIHRDLKLENVLVDKDENMKVMDFGLSRVFSDSQSNSELVAKTQCIGTSIYMAPEIITSSQYTSHVDVFSFAILIYVILTERFDPYETQISNIEYKVAHDPDFRPNLIHLANSNVPPSILGWLKKYIVNSWDHDPFNRPSFSDWASLFQKKYLQIGIDEEIEIDLEEFKIDNMIGSSSSSNSSSNTSSSEESEEESYSIGSSTTTNSSPVSKMRSSFLKSSTKKLKQTFSLSKLKKQSSVSQQGGSLSSSKFRKSSRNSRKSSNVIRKLDVILKKEKNEHKKMKKKIEQVEKKKKVVQKKWNSLDTVYQRLKRQVESKKNLIEKLRLQIIGVDVVDLVDVKKKKRKKNKEKEEKKEEESEEESESEEEESEDEDDEEEESEDESDD